MTRQPMMTCAEVDEALLEYLEETLDPASRARVDEHVAGCLRCSAVLRDIGGIRTEAARLPDLSPSRNLWPEISARIEPTVVPLGTRPQREAPRIWIPAAAAAAALVVATAGITYIATSRSLAPSTTTVAAAPQEPARVPANPPSATPGGAGETAVAESSAAPAETATEASRTRTVIGGREPSAALASRRGGTSLSTSEVAYGDEIRRLQNIITVRRGELDPATVLVIEQSLRIIDAAVKQSRAALARDPRSGFLTDQLNHALDKKIELLRTVALLPSRT